MKTILIQGNSLALPSTDYDYNKTWPCYLREEFDDYHVIVKAEPGKTTNDLHNSTGINYRRQLESYNPNIVIIQLGVSDCAPRILNKYEKAVVSLQPINFIDKVTKYMANRFRTRSKGRAYVSPEKFRKNIETYLKRAEKNGVKKAIIVKILQPGEKYKRKNHEKVKGQIQLYNSILEEISDDFEFSQTIHPLADNPRKEVEIVDKYTREDGNHTNTEGEKLIFDRLKSRIGLN